MPTGAVGIGLSRRPFRAMPTALAVGIGCDPGSATVFAVTSANFAGRPSTVVSVDFTARPSVVASADFAGRPSTVVFTYFIAGIYFRLQIMMQLFFIYNQSLLMVIG